MYITHELYLLIAIGEIDAKYLTFDNILFALIPVALTVLWYKIAPSLTPYIRNIICIASLLSAIILFIITPHKIECLGVAIGISLIAGIMLFNNWLDPENNILHSRLHMSDLPENTSFLQNAIFFTSLWTIFAALFKW